MKQKGDGMKAVYEELNGDLAVFIVDNVSKTFHVNAAELPKDAEPGDVFEVEIRMDEELKLGSKLPTERKRREQSARAKREALLKRSQNKK